MAAQDELPERPPVHPGKWVATVFQRRRDLATLVDRTAQRVGARTVARRRLSSGEVQVVDLRLEGGHPDALAAHVRALPVAGEDVVLQPDNEDRCHMRLLVMDVDSTLIQQEVIDEIARAAGAHAEVAAITERAMNGELGFQASLRARVAALAGVSTSVFADVLARLQLTEGAQLLIGTMKALGGRVAIISGGFIEVVEPLRTRLGIDHAFANTLAVADGKLTGRVEGAIVDRPRKAALLAQIADAEGVPLTRVVAIGDGANDLDMLGRAGLGIAFNAKPAVRDEARHRLSQPSLRSVLYLLGLDDDAIARLSPSTGR